MNNEAPTSRRDAVVEPSSELTERAPARGSARPRAAMRLVGALSPFSTLLFLLRFRRAAVLVYRGATVVLARDAFSGPGRVSVGKRWRGQPPRPTSLVVFEGGRLRALGRFAFHRGADVRVAPGGVLTLGDGYAADNVHIDCHHRVTIGNGAAIAKGVVIMDTDHHDIVGKPKVAEVRIGERCWIGAGATVLKGVTIGDGAVVGAASVVTRDVPPDTIVVGNPARPLGPVEWRL